jgi:predicted nucleic acid-binding protein
VVTGLLDSAVIVDLLRRYAPAENWLSRQAQLGVTSIVWLEIIQGAENSTEQRRALRLLRRFEQIDPLPEDFRWAIERAIRFRLTYNIGAIDCLIAATSQRLQVPLYTTNLKHFVPLLGSLAQKPY